MGREADSVIERVIEYCRRVNMEFRLKRVILFDSRSRGNFYGKGGKNSLIPTYPFLISRLRQHIPHITLTLLDMRNKECRRNFFDSSFNSPCSVSKKINTL